MGRINIDFNNVPVKDAVIGGKKCSFRSKGEYNLAVYLQFLKETKQIKDWAYEQTRFCFPDETRGAKEFLVDFDVLNNDGTFEYWEYKGWLRGQDLTKFKRVAKYRPEVKMVLVMSGKRKKDFNRLYLLEKYTYRIIFAPDLFRPVKRMLNLI